MFIAVLTVLSLVQLIGTIIYIRNNPPEDFPNVTKEEVEPPKTIKNININAEENGVKERPVGEGGFTVEESSNKPLPNAPHPRQHGIGFTGQTQVDVLLQDLSSPTSNLFAKLDTFEDKGKAAVQAMLYLEEEAHESTKGVQVLRSKALEAFLKAQLNYNKHHEEIPKDEPYFPPANSPMDDEAFLRVHDGAGALGVLYAALHNNGKALAIAAQRNITKNLLTMPNKNTLLTPLVARKWILLWHAVVASDLAEAENSKDSMFAVLRRQFVKAGGRGFILSLFEDEACKASLSEDAILTGKAIDIFNLTSFNTQKVDDGTIKYLDNDGMRAMLLQHIPQNVMEQVCRERQCA